MMDINLLPEEMRTNFTLIKGNKIKIILAIFLTMAILYFALFGLEYYLHNKILRLDGQIQSMGQVKDFKEEIFIKNNEINLITSIVDERNTSSTNFYDLIKRLEKLIPKGVTFTSQRGEKGSMIISGRANREEEVAELAANVYQLEEAHNVWIQSTAYGEKIHFEITFFYKSNGGQELESQ